MTRADAFEAAMRQSTIAEVERLAAVPPLNADVAQDVAGALAASAP